MKKPLYSEPNEGISKRDTRQSRRIWKPKHWNISRSKILTKGAFIVLSKLRANHLASLGWVWRPKQSNVIDVDPVDDEEELPLKDRRSLNPTIVSLSPSRSPVTSVQKSKPPLSECAPADRVISGTNADHRRRSIVAPELRAPRKAQPCTPELIDDIVNFSGVGKEKGIFYHVKFAGFDSHENDTYFYRRCEFPDIETLAALLAEGLKAKSICWDQVTDKQLKKRVRKLLPPNFFN